MRLACYYKCYSSFGIVIMNSSKDTILNKWVEELVYRLFEGVIKASYCEGTPEA